MATKLKDNYILSYFQQIKNGSVTVGQWIEKLYDYIQNGLNNKLFFFDQKQANDAVEWIEENCFHVEGALAPNKFKLELWQKAFISCLFGIVDENGKRQFREVFLVVARKNGKSLLASAIAKYMWYVAGGYGAQIFCIAPKLAQADIIYDAVWHMTELDPKWKALKDEIQATKDVRGVKTKDDSELARHTQSDLRIPATNSKVKKIAFSAKKSDGFNPSLAICDEIASWEGDKGLKVYEVMQSATGAREIGNNPAIILSCTTAGYISDSIYDELMKRATSFLMGNSREKRLLPFLYIADDINKWNDLNELRKSNPNMGISVLPEFYLEQIAIAESSLSKRAEFIVKYNCLKQNSSQAFLNYEDVEKASGDPLRFEDFENCYALLGIDLSQTTDLTAACCLIQKNDDFYIFCQFFLPEEKLEEATARDGLPYAQYVKRGLLTLAGSNTVDYHAVSKWCGDLVKKYKIFPLMTGYDRYSANYLITELQNNYGLKCDDVFQGHQLYPIIRTFEGFLKDGRIHIGTNDLLKIHFLNAALRMDQELNRGKLVKIKPTDHIDGLAAVIDAFTVRDKWWGHYGTRLENK